jgi:hypothetical protein
MLKTILNKVFWGVLRHLLSDSQYIKVRHLLENGYLPDLKTPKRLSEKIHYIKLHDRSELRRLVADRLEVRDYVAEKAGSEFLIPLIGCFKTLTPKTWRSLPDRFVLKASHGSAMVKIVRSKSEENFEEVRALTKTWVNSDYSAIGREWVYRDLARQIIAEELIEALDGKPVTEYKFLCFHGKMKLFYKFEYRPDGARRRFYDENLNPLDLSFRLPGSGRSAPLPPPIENESVIRKAITLSENLSEDFDLIRVDLYITENDIWFGELTNFPGNGFNPLVPDEMDRHYGEFLRLN